MINVENIEKYKGDEMNRLPENKTYRKIRMLLFDIFIISMLIFMGLSIYELNRNYNVVDIDQPFITGKIVNGKFVPCKDFKLGDRIYTQIKGKKYLPYLGKVYLIIQDTFRYELKPYELSCPIGEIHQLISVPTNSWWNAGSYKVIATLVYREVGIFKRVVTYNLETEYFNLR